MNIYLIELLIYPSFTLIFKKRKWKVKRHDINCAPYLYPLTIENVPGPAGAHL